MAFLHREAYAKPPLSLTVRLLPEMLQNGGDTPY